MSETLNTIHGSFALAEDREAGSTSWHAHCHHQLLFASAGSLQLHLPEGRRWLLPSQRAAWIPAGTQHKVSTAYGYDLKTVYFDPCNVKQAYARCGVFAVTPVLREMILYSMRWKKGVHECSLARDYFSLLSALCGEWISEPLGYSLPGATSDDLSRAMQYVLEDLETPTLAGAARAAHLSTRTLSRRFNSEAGTTFKKFVHQARLLRAAELLTSPTIRIADVATEIGLSSHSALSDAFKQFFGVTPSYFQDQQSE